MDARESQVVYIALGSNLGDRDEHLAWARAAIGSLPRSRLIAQSSIHETQPLGPPGQDAYLNQMVAVETPLAPRDLLEALQEIERRHGRRRDTRWGARTLDLDIVAYGDVAIAEPDLVIPHPELANRDFWQRELAEIRADLQR